LKSLAEALQALLDFEKLKYCFECGICTASCPVAELIPEYYNPRILLHSLPLGEEKTLKSPELWLCAWCYRCYRRCPQGVKLPEIFQAVRKFAIERGHLEGFDKALKIIRENIPLPASCGYVCFHPERAIDNKQLLADAVQKPILNYQAQKIEEQKATATRGEKVAIIGSGPAGLTAAQELAKKGYAVTVFEALPKPGGMLRRCIPKYRLPKKTLDAEIEHIKALGVEIKTNTMIGKDLTIDELLQDGYKAVFIATGAHEERRLRVEGEELEGVFHSLDFLEKVNMQEKVKLGNKIMVIGGGNVAIDSARTALRLGAKKVTILYRRSREEMPANPWEIQEAEEEGVEIQFLVAPKKIVSENGKVSAIECLRMELGEPDETGRRRPIPVEGSEFTVETEAVIMAIGQTPNLVYLPQKVEITEERTIATDPFTLETSLPGFFAGGDVALGPATVMEAIIAGKRAAISIDSYLRGQPLESTKILENLRRSMNGNPST
jgi:NADPH-dependent glutamate synthase beta subunit-like oxidoreductase